MTWTSQRSRQPSRSRQSSRRRGAPWQGQQQQQQRYLWECPARSYANKLESTKCVQCIPQKQNNMHSKTDSASIPAPWKRAGTRRPPSKANDHEDALNILPCSPEDARTHRCWQEPPSTSPHELGEFRKALGSTLEGLERQISCSHELRLDEAQLQALRFEYSVVFYQLMYSRAPGAGTAKQLGFVSRASAGSPKPPTPNGRPRCTLRRAKDQSPALQEELDLAEELPDQFRELEEPAQEEPDRKAAEASRSPVTKPLRRPCASDYMGEDGDEELVRVPPPSRGHAQTATRVAYDAQWSTPCFAAAGAANSLHAVWACLRFLRGPSQRAEHDVRCLSQLFSAPRLGCRPAALTGEGARLAARGSRASRQPASTA